MNLRSLKNPDDMKRFLADRGYNTSAAFEQYEKERHIPAHVYARNKKTEFLSSISDSAYFVYLDLNIWIHFRDVLLGQELNNKWEAVYQYACELADDQEVYFVTSLPLLFETQKQRVDQHRSTFISLASKLSKEVGIDHYQNLIVSEIQDFIVGFVLKNESHREKRYQFNRASLVMKMNAS